MAGNFEEKTKKNMAATTIDSACVYRNPDAPVEARVQDLLSRMTLQEKIGQMTQIERSVASEDVLTDYFIGIHYNHKT